MLSHRLVAIKLMRNASLHSEQEKARFFHEAEVLQRLKHPNILPLVDVGIYDDSPYLITEYAPHGSLRNRLNQQPDRQPPIEDALSILSQIGQALHYAHKQEIMHRDLKPENILLAVNDEAMLADFGLAMILQTMNTTMKNLGVEGTPAYMAPEQFKGEVSKKSDQYALGCIAYELFTGQKPFPANSIHELMYKHFNEDPIPLCQLNPSLPRNIEQAVLKALSKRSNERFTDIWTFITALGINKTEYHAKNASDNITNNNSAAQSNLYSSPTKSLPLKFMVAYHQQFYENHPDEREKFVQFHDLNICSTKDFISTLDSYCRKSRIIEIVMLRKISSLKSFINWDQKIDTIQTRAGCTSTEQIRRLILTARKQISRERRAGQILLRDTGVLADAEVSKGQKSASFLQSRLDCQTTYSSCGSCPNCMIYGSVPIRSSRISAVWCSRVRCQEGFSIRSIEQLMPEISSNVIPTLDTPDDDKLSKTVVNGKDLHLQVFVPTVETLEDVTGLELIYVLGNILKITKYDDEKDQANIVHNHILGIYFLGNLGLYHNLTLTERYYDFITTIIGGQAPSPLNARDLLSIWPEVEKITSAYYPKQPGRIKDLSKLLARLQALYEDKAMLYSILKRLNKEEMFKFERRVKL